MRASNTMIMAIAFIGSSVSALPQYAKRATGGSFENFRPAGPGDLRSPCPAINAMANHGFLPHNGRGVTLELLTAAIDEAFNVGADFAALTGGFALKFNTAAPHTEFTLQELNLHNSIEHDGSLSRSDEGDPFGDNHSFNQTVFNQVLSHVPAGQKTFDVKSAAEGRRARLIAQKGSNPVFQFTTKSAVLSYVETALYLTVLDSPQTLAPKVDYVKVLFEDERLPFAEGWRRSATSISLSTLIGVSAQLQGAALVPENVQAPFVFGPDILKALA